MRRSAIGVRHSVMRQSGPQHEGSSGARTQYSVLSTRQSPRMVPCVTWISLLLLVALATRQLHAAPPAPVTDLKAEDVPNDDGTAITLTWKRPKSENRIVEYVIFKWADRDRTRSSLTLLQRLVPQSILQYTPFGIQGLSVIISGGQSIGDVTDKTEYVVTGMDPNATYTFSVSTTADSATGEQESSDDVSISGVRPIRNWFNRTKLWFALLTISVCGTVIVCTELARRGKPFYVRPIAGLQAIEEAVGRATEMGKPMLFVPGIQDMNEIDTVAGLTILASVAKTAAEYDTPLEVPTTRALVMTAAREAVQAAALAAGRPDYYNEERIYYVTDEQFGYVASVCGWMYREKPAACFFLGKFYAESLILAETGNAVGAIQIAGTAETTQLPFFVAACDYTLLGEELFAASAYLSGEPAQLGMLKGQDFGKLAAMVLVVVGCLVATWDAVSPRGTDDDGKALPQRVRWITDTVLKGG